MTYKTQGPRRFESAKGPHNHATQTRSKYNKPLPMFAKDFHPAKGAWPVSVFIGSHEAVAATKENRVDGTRSQVCIKPSDNPTAYSWGFLHSLPVMVFADDDLPLETVHSLVIELARCGVAAVSALSLSGKLLAHYSPEVGRAAA